jgi:hypothetical protein
MKYQSGADWKHVLAKTKRAATRTGGVSALWQQALRFNFYHVTVGRDPSQDQRQRRRRSRGTRAARCLNRSPALRSRARAAQILREGRSEVISRRRMS